MRTTSWLTPKQQTKAELQNKSCGPTGIYKETLFKPKISISLNKAKDINPDFKFQRNYGINLKT